MKKPTDDQEARIRYAYRVYSEGGSYGAPQSAYEAALGLIEEVGLNHRIGSLKTSQEFRALAVKTL